MSLSYTQTHTHTQILGNPPALLWCTLAACPAACLEQSQLSDIVLFSLWTFLTHKNTQGFNFLLSLFFFSYFLLCSLSICCILNCTQKYLFWCISPVLVTEESDSVADTNINRAYSEAEGRQNNTTWKLNKTQTIKRSASRDGWVCVCGACVWDVMDGDIRPPKGVIPFLHFTVNWSCLHKMCFYP